MDNIFETHRKAKSVINSCDDARQLKAAKRYMNLWFKYYTKTNNKGQYIASTLVRELYEKLQKLMYVKKYKLTKYISE
jgi:hypothetical protein